MLLTKIRSIVICFNLSQLRFQPFSHPSIHITHIHLLFLLIHSPIIYLVFLLIHHNHIFLKYPDLFAVIADRHNLRPLLRIQLHAGKKLLNMIRQFLSLARRHITTDKLLILRTADHISTDYGKLLYRILRPGLSLPSVIGYRFQNIMIFHINIENPLPHRYDLSTGPLISTLSFVLPSLSSFTRRVHVSGSRYTSFPSMRFLYRLSSSVCIAGFPSALLFLMPSICFSYHCMHLSLSAVASLKSTFSSCSVCSFVRYRY